jgi:hypothetical protein
VLHLVIRQHLEDFLRAAADRADGAGLPEFVAREFREFLTCGVLAHGYAPQPRTHGDRVTRTWRASTCTPTCGWGPNDRARLEQLCRYLIRPPLADDRLRLLGDGRVRVQLKRAWSDGTTHLLFEPVGFLEKLAALTPRPAINLILYHGVLAPYARWRPEVVAFGRPEGALAPGRGRR